MRRETTLARGGYCQRWKRDVWFVIISVALNIRTTNVFKLFEYSGTNLLSGTPQNLKFIYYKLFKHCNLRL